MRIEEEELQNSVGKVEMKNSLLELAEIKIRKLLGTDIIHDLLPHQQTEPRGNYINFANKVIRPRSTFEVSSVMSILNEMSVKVIPYCGGTGLVGGQIAPSSDYFLLSLDRMNALRDVSFPDKTLTVEAGMILSEVHNQAKKIDRMFPLSLASEGTCQIGGNLATNAGGINVIKFGNARSLCSGIEAVLADGKIYNGLSSLIKDNTGYDLRNLLIGSEGTLGIITAATLKTVPIPDETIVAIVKIGSPADAVVLLQDLEKEMRDQVYAFELINQKGLEFLKHGGFNYKEPFSVPSEWMVLIEVSGTKSIGLRPLFENILHTAMKENLVSDAVISSNDAQVRDLWSIRENIPEANRLIGAICSSDVSVPISSIPSFIELTFKSIKTLSSKLQINCFGHLGDGNIHFNVFPPFGSNKECFDEIKDDIVRLIHENAMKLNGSFSAEHGVGRLKVDDLDRYGDSGKLIMMRAVKKALDPNLILNPGVLVADF